MMQWMSAFFLVAGAALCLLAAVGVLRLPDFFMRMHAATKAGVVGSGLILVGVGFADMAPGTWAKVGLAILFLLLTTPVAGHMLGRAAYVGGAPLWRGTAGNALRGVLRRAEFGRQAQTSLHPKKSANPHIRSIVLALAKGPHMRQAIVQAIALAREHGADLCGVAIIDVPRLSNVGPVPIGAGWHAQQMRERRIRLARQAAADVIQTFEELASPSGLRWSVRLEEGRPSRIISSLAHPDCLITVAPGGWFDQGVLDLKVHVSRRLRWSGLRRDIVELEPATDTLAR
jgi:monovalent cation/proton antiporter MnhG/PhaG subunit